MNKFLSIINDLFSFENLKRVFIKKNKVIFIGIITILFFNTFLYILTDNVKIKKIQSREKTTGFSHDKAQKFFYFFYYTGNFPLATLNENLKYSKKDALAEIENNGSKLIMEYKHWSRLGENLRVIAYYPNAIIRGSPKNPSIKLFNTILFVLGLMSIFIAFVRVNKTFFGAILVLIVNLTPFFIYEVYQNQNIFALLASIFLIILGINLKWIFSKKTSLIQSLIVPIITGIIIGTSSEIRGETIIIIVSAILIYLLSKSFTWYLKTLAIILVILGVLFTKKEINNYFNSNFNKTYGLVKQHGGHTYDGKRIKGHRFWHPVFCGLGDFDKKYGYKWNDRAAYSYAIPVLKEKYNMNLKYNKGDLHLNEYYDKDSLYYKKFDEIDEYEEVVKNKVLNDIKNDPFWYVTILFKRAIRILTKTLPFPFLGWVFLILLFFLFKIKQSDYLKLLVISLPLSFTPFFIYSGDGATYNSFFPILTLTILISLVIEYYLTKKSRKT